MGLAMITVLEIFSNPTDLEFTIGQGEKGDKRAIGIFRGPGHNYKAVLTSRPFAGTQEDALKVIEEILQAVHKIATKECEDRNSLAGSILNPAGNGIDQSVVLNQERIVRIIEELREHGKASTREMFSHTKEE